MSELKILEVINVRWYNAEADYAFKLSKSLDTLRADVTIMGIPGSPVIKMAESAGLKTVTDIDINTQNPIKSIINYNKLKSFLKKEQFDIVNFHRSEGFIIGALACRKAGTKVVRTRGDMRPVRRGFVNNMLYNSLTDIIITSGDIIKDGLKERLKCKDKKLQTVYTAVDTAFFSPEKRSAKLKKELGLAEGVRIVSILGRLGNVKGHDLFLKAARLVKDQAEDVHFLIIGKEVESEKSGIKGLVKELGLADNVSFIMGRRDDIDELAASVDIGVITSTASEANCRVAIEWMSSGVPVVAFATGVIPEVVADGQTGYVVEIGDYNTLADRIRTLLSDIATVERFKTGSRERAVKEFDLKVLGERTLKIYSDIM